MKSSQKSSNIGTSNQIQNTENRIFTIILIVCPIGGLIFLFANLPSIVPAIFWGFGLSSASYFLMGDNTSENEVEASLPTVEASLPTIAKIKLAGNLAAIMGSIVLLNWIIEQQTSINFQPNVDNWVALDRSGRSPVSLEVKTNIATNRPIDRVASDIFKNKDHLEIEQDSNFIRVITDEGFYLGMLNPQEDLNQHDFYNINDNNMLTALENKEEDHPIKAKIREHCLDGTGICAYPERPVVLSSYPGIKIPRGEAHACDRDLVGYPLIIFNGEGEKSRAFTIEKKAPCSRKELIQINELDAKELFSEKWKFENDGIATITPFGLVPQVR